MKIQLVKTDSGWVRSHYIRTNKDGSLTFKENPSYKNNLMKMKDREVYARKAGLKFRIKVIEKEYVDAST